MGEGRIVKGATKREGEGWRGRIRVEGRTR